MTDFARALVTGASSGIGRAMAEQLAADGTDLVVVARREDELRELATWARDTHDGEVEVLATDLTEPEELAVVERRLEQEDRPVDLLVNNAGMSSYGSFADLDVERYDREVALNSTAPVRLTHAALPGMIDRGRGAVLFTSSTSSFQPMPSMAVYGATKAFLTSFSQALHEELAGTGVSATVLCPGFTDTAFLGDSQLPQAVVMDPGTVARAGLAAVRRGRAVATPGAGNKAHRALAHIVPRTLLRRAAGKVL